MVEDERGKRNRGEYARSMQVVDYIYMKRNTTVPEIARDLQISERQVRRDLQYVKDYYAIDTKAGRTGGVSWKEGKFTDLDMPRKEVQDYLDIIVGIGDSGQFIRIMQELNYDSQERMYRIMMRLFSCWVNSAALILNHAEKVDYSKNKTK